MSGSTSEQDAVDTARARTLPALTDSIEGCKHRLHLPAKEITSLADYRVRHAQYRYDLDLQAAHQVAPWAVVWDDHEVENNYANLVRDGLSMKPSERRGVRIYKATDGKGAKWTRTLIDEGGVAVEDLTVDDLDGDGKPDIVAVGRQTHNVRIYWNQGGK